MQNVIEGGEERAVGGRILAFACFLLSRRVQVQQL